MRRLLLTVGVLLGLLGCCAAMPVAMARWHHLSAEAEISDVFLERTGSGIPDGQARVLVDLEFAVEEDHAHVTWCSLGGNQADQRLRPLADPVVPLDQAQARARALAPDELGRRHTCTVYFLPGQADQAVMVSPALTASLGAYDVGLALVACGMLTFLVGRRLPVQLS